MKSHLKLDVLEVALIVVLAVACTLAVTAHRRILKTPPEVEWLAKTYGPQKHSQYLEEWIVRDFFEDRRGGTFVDIGAADYEELSNTYFLEQERGWSGIAVDAQPSFGADYVKYRPKTRFDNFFVSDVSEATATLYVNKANPWVASAEQSFTERWNPKTSSIRVPTITLDDLLKAHGLTSFDFLSIDIELAEPKALKGFDIERFHPSLVCIEAHPEVRQQILDYFARHAYVVIGKYLRMEEKNLYFMPVGHQVKPLPADVMALWTER